MPKRLLFLSFMLMVCVIGSSNARAGVCPPHCDNTCDEDTSALKDLRDEFKDSATTDKRKDSIRGEISDLNAHMKKMKCDSSNAADSTSKVSK